jgi:hypothetical protein
MLWQIRSLESRCVPTCDLSVGEVFAPVRKTYKGKRDNGLKYVKSALQ